VPKINSFLFIEPDLHYLNYGSLVMRDIVKAASKPEYTVVELQGDAASPAAVDAAISANDPSFVFGLGHGGPCVFTVECTAAYMSVKSGSHSACDQDRRLDKVGGRVIHLNSCLTGQELGPAIRANGARAYIGSTDSFWFYIGSAPNSDRAARSMFLAEYQVEVSLMAGLSVEQAWRDSQARHDQEIAYWTTGEGRNHVNAASLVRILQINKSISIMIGEGGTKVGTPLLPANWALLGLAGGMTPLIAVGAVISTDQLEKLRRWLGWASA